MLGLGYNLDKKNNYLKKQTSKNCPLNSWKKIEKVDTKTFRDTNNLHVLQSIVTPLPA